jgi:DNA-binding NarL/FixJ family response regulator
MDLAMPTVPCTPELVEAVVSQGVPVVMLSGSEDHNLLAACLVAGARAILSKDESVEAILDAIEQAQTGGEIRATNRVSRLQRFEEQCRQTKERRRMFEQLTPCEAQVLRLLMDGHSAADIASDRSVSLPTVRTQIKAVLAKLGVNSQLEAVALAYRRGFGFSDNEPQFS